MANGSSIKRPTADEKNPDKQRPGPILKGKCRNNETRSFCRMHSVIFYKKADLYNKMELL